MQTAPKVEKKQKTGAAVAVRTIFSMERKIPSRRRNEAKELEADRRTMVKGKQALIQIKVIVAIERNGHQGHRLERNGHPGHRLEIEVETQDPVSPKRDHHPAGHAARNL
jgi:hypothetical protein